MVSNLSGRTDRNALTCSGLVSRRGGIARVISVGHTIRGSKASAHWLFPSTNQKAPLTVDIFSQAGTLEVLIRPTSSANVTYLPLSRDN
ncbi:unnamed protein product [Nezara viridula]|uniref:Uncharacterized protein n=1 Tax=Nezara viridula TaxID=85310 RepID=A0A9P0HDD4_NEZVI|nr:unnamed protein product [Nezara viridula]